MIKVRAYFENGVVSDWILADRQFAKSKKMREVVRKKVVFEDCSADVFIWDSSIGDMAKQEYLYTIISLRGRVSDPIYYCRELRYQ